MSVDHDATTTPAPDATTVRAALRALIAQLLQAVPPALRAVMVVVPVLRAAMVPLRAAMVPVLRAVTVPLRDATVIAVTVVIRSVRALPVVTVQLLPAVRAATRSERALLVVMTGVPVDEASRSALAPVVIARTVRATTVRATTTPSSLKRSHPTICTHRRATS